jgi:hypothetical protein
VLLCTGWAVVLQLGRIPEDVLAVITGRLLQGLVFMHAKHMVSQRPFLGKLSY